MRSGSLFSGIGGMDLAFEQAGFTVAWQVEIDRAANKILAKHWPGVTRYGDIQDVAPEELAPVDVIVFGSPCTDLSVAGKRAGLKGEQSGLFYEAIRIIRGVGPSLALWENVPGAFSSNGGRDFGAILTAFRASGVHECAWRVLDAQYFGVAQRRRRVFLVADFRGDRATQILFERASVSGDSPPRRSPGQVAPSLLAGGAGANRPAGIGSESDCLVGDTAVAFDVRNLREGEAVSGTLQAKSTGGTSLNFINPVCIPTLAHTLTARMDSSEDGSGRGTPVVPVGMMVRRLMPIEAERLQGLPDGWTRWDAEGNELPDSARYRMIGNSVAVPVVQWIAERMKKALGE